MSNHNSLSAPLVSVVIPTYNRPDYLEQAIASAVNQTYQNIEIIVTDNCSPENPQAIVESFGDSRIKFWRQPENIGMLPNQLHGFKMAQGKYFASLHDDDIWNHDFLAKLVPILEADSELILAFCDQYIIDGEGKIKEIGTEENTHAYKRDQLKAGVHKPFFKIALVDKSIAIAASCVIRNHSFDWNNIPLEVGGMWDLYLAYLCSISGFGAYYHPERLTKYRAHEQTDTMLSGSRNIQAKIRKAKNEMFCYQVLMNDHRLTEFHSYFEKQWLSANTTLGIGLLKNKQTVDARPYLWQALSQQKFNLRTIAVLILSFTPRILWESTLNL